MALTRRDSSWGNTQSTVPILCTLAVFVAVSIVFMGFGLYQRRRFNQRMIQAGLPANWNGLNWALMPRRRTDTKDLGPRPELIDAVLISPLAVENSGSWSSIIPLSVQLEPYTSCLPPNTVGLEQSDIPLATSTGSSSSHPRQRTGWPRFILPNRPGEAFIFNSHPGILAEKGPLSTAQLADATPRMANVSILITMPIPSRKGPAAGEFAGLALGMTPAMLH